MRRRRCRDPAAAPRTEEPTGGQRVRQSGVAGALHAWLRQNRAIDADRIENAPIHRPGVARRRIKTFGGIGVFRERPANMGVRVTGMLRHDDARFAGVCVRRGAQWCIGGCVLYRGCFLTRIELAVTTSRPAAVFKPIRPQRSGIGCFPHVGTGRTTARRPSGARRSTGAKGASGNKQIGNGLIFEL